MLKNGLYIVATPIGNLGDVSRRALEVLAEAPVIACEDTRVAKKLFNLLGLPLSKTFVAYQDHNEEDKAQAVARMAGGTCPVALISDAGSPLVSDPGYKLVRLCRQQQIPVYVVPGASAVIAALQLSGLPTNRFMFAGFIPVKDKARVDLFNELKNINTTLVFYETANRLLKTLEAAGGVFGSREVAVVREITKLYEDCRNGTFSELAEYFRACPPKGEIVLVVAPPAGNGVLEIDVEEELKSRLSGMSLKSAVDEVAALAGLRRGEVYAAALKLKEGRK